MVSIFDIMFASCKGDKTYLSRLMPSNSIVNCPYARCENVSAECYWGAASRRG